MPNLQVLERSVQAWYSISRCPKGLHKPQFLKPYDASRLASSGAKLFALGRCVGWINNYVMVYHSHAHTGYAFPFPSPPPRALRLDGARPKGAIRLVLYYFPGNGLTRFLVLHAKLSLLHYSKPSSWAREGTAWSPLFQHCTFMLSTSAFGIIHGAE